jgi:hypothetical protein
MKANDFAVELKQIDQPSKDPVQSLKIINNYFFMQGTFNDEIMYDAIKTISEFQKVLLKMRKLIEKFITLISESEKKFDLNIKRMKDLNKMVFEYENISAEIYQNTDNEYLGRNSYNQK